MKKDFLKAALRSPWAMTGLVVLGAIIGAGLATAAVLWVVPQFTKDSVPEAPTPQQQEVQEASPSSHDWRQAAFIGETTPYQLDVFWREDARKLAENEAAVVLTADATNPASSQEHSQIQNAFRTLTSEEAEAENDPYRFETWDYEGMWDVGEIQGDPWKGATVYHLRINYQGMGGGFQHIYLIRPQDGSSAVFGVGLPPMGIADEEPMAQLLRGITFLPNATINNVEMPQALTLENGQSITRDDQTNWVSDVFRFDGMDSLREIARTREGLPIYEYREQNDQNLLGCLYVFAPDGERVRYRSVITRTPTEERYTQGPLEIQWDAAYQNTTKVDYMERRYGGCGGFACTSIVSDENARAAGGLTRAGVTQAGDILYIPTRLQDHPTVKELYDGWYIPDGNTKPPIVEMIRQFPTPIFYWKDALGRWVEYRSMAILPMAECGKPVIYLYPEQTTDISVRLPSFINVTVSDPTYPSAGWNVTAQPNGQLTSHEDGKPYGSLYWEGTGVGYMPPTEGFVIKDGEVESFLHNILPKYGLNETEAREFMEFWLLEMTGAPYYRISFLTSAWNNAAPLYVSPRPQTSIRIFMDWKPLSAPISLSEPTIVTPEREGFTLVEWGGTLWK